MEKITKMLSNLSSLVTYLCIHLLHVCLRSSLVALILFSTRVATLTGLAINSAFETDCRCFRFGQHFEGGQGCS